MSHELLTHPISAAEMWEELRFLASYFCERDCVDCEIHFGFAWIIDYYAGEIPIPERVSLASLADKVLAVETSGVGKLGSDELYVEIAGLSFRFCDESDIHIYFETTNSMVDDFYSRWKMLGYMPAEYEKLETGQQGKRLRFN